MTNEQNCYSYAFDIQKTEPGTGTDNFNCGGLLRNIFRDMKEKVWWIGDSPLIAYSECPKGYNMIYSVVDEHNKDFHFYKKYDKTWSHKPGVEDVTFFDSENKIITNPAFAGRIYSNYQYSTPCGFLCAKAREEAR